MGVSTIHIKIEFLWFTNGNPDELVLVVFVAADQEQVPGKQGLKLDVQAIAGYLDVGTSRASSTKTRIETLDRRSKSRI